MASRLNPASLLQLYTELLFVEPIIWRRLLVPDTITLVQLHQVIQVAMGWEDCHLHEFELAGRRYGVVDNEWNDAGLIDEKRTRLVSILKKHQSLTYRYDFGDSWLHKLTLEEIQSVTEPQRYAVCLGGGNACPPEDVGGPGGYRHFVEAIRHPGYEEHEAMLEWYGGAFHPSDFDRNKTNQALKRIKL